MVKNVLHPNKFKWECNQKNIVGWITTLNNVKSGPQVDPGGIQKLPEQGPSLLPQIPKRSTPLCGRRMSIDADPLDHFIAFGRPFPAGAQYRYLITLLKEQKSLSPNTSIEGNRLV